MIFPLLRAYAWSVFLVLWAVVAWGDWQHQKVKHWQLRWGSAAAAVGYALLIGNTVLGAYGRAQVFHYWGFYQAVGAHFLLCATVAVALWVLRVWPAGDAKLFCFLAFLYPLLNVTGSFPERRLFLTALINTFIPAAVFLFVTAVLYVFNTRLCAGQAFLAQMGWRRELDFLAGKIRESLGVAWALALEKWTWFRGLGFKTGALWLWGLIVLLAPKLLQWLLGMSFMTLLSYYLKDFFRSPVLLSLLCVAMFLLWNQVRQIVGTGLARIALAVGLAALFLHDPPTHWERLGEIFGSLTVFSFFMFLGMNAATGLLSDGSRWISTLVLPVLSVWVMMIAMKAWNFALNAGADARRVAGAWVHRVAGPWARSAAAQARPMWHAPPALHLDGPARGAARAVARIAERTGRSGFDAALSNLRPYLGVFAELSAMGLFFGMSLVLVKLWDDEVRPSHRTEALASHLLLAPAFIDRIREDSEFFEAHFQSMYADGLTFEQAEALKGWCAERGIEKVPLAPTMSFATWIFFGYFLSLMLGGRNLLEAVL